LPGAGFDDGATVGVEEVAEVSGEVVADGVGVPAEALGGLEQVIEVKGEGGDALDEENCTFEAEGGKVGGEVAKDGDDEADDGFDSKKEENVPSAKNEFRREMCGEDG
jgi:hypothetical protein